MNHIHSLRKLFCCLWAIVLGSTLFAAEQSVPQWQPHDETADIELLSHHANQSMHFRLLNSRVLNKNSLWAPFNDALVDIDERRYEALKPLILDQGIPAIQSAVAAGDLDYETVVKFYLYRIRDIESDNQHSLNAIISLNPAAIERARTLDRLRTEGTAVADDSLFGIPVLLKDNVGFAGLPTTAGAIALRSNTVKDAFIVEQLISAGAVILGKANLSEWAYFFCNNCPSGYSAMGGQTLNPYGRFRFGTGGSSSGSGAAVAANYAMVAIGSETSGSILSPASSNSLVGLKPTTGNLSRTGIVPISATLDTAGPMSRSVEDAVILYNGLVGFDSADTAMPMSSADAQLVYRTTSLSGKRLGVINGMDENPEFQSVLALLEENGAGLVRFDFTMESFPRFSEFLGAEMKRDLALYLEGFAADEVSINSIADLQEFNLQDTAIRAPYGQALVDMMAEMNLSASELESLRGEMQTRARNQLDRLFREQQLDVLLSQNNRHAGLAALANYPALTIPGGYEDNGRPFGLTLIAPSFQEQDLIDIGATFEAFSRARRQPAAYR